MITMADTTTIRISRATHAQVTRLEAERWRCMPSPPVTFSSYLEGTRSDSTTSIPRPARTSGPSVTTSRERCAGQPVIPRYVGDGWTLDVDEVECDRTLLDSRAQLIREAVHQPAPGRVRSAISREC